MSLGGEGQKGARLKMWRLGSGRKISSFNLLLLNLSFAWPLQKETYTIVPSRRNLEGSVSDQQESFQDDFDSFTAKALVG